MKFRNLFTLLLLSFTATVRGQQFTEPGWFQYPERTRSGHEMPEVGQASFGLMSLGAGPAIAEAITPEIESLARGLEHDPKRIFDWVQGRIRYVHYFGSKKGAQLTLLERSGNDFDQCALLVALLRAAGLDPAYEFGLTYIPYEQPNERDFRHWLGLTMPAINISEALDFAIDLNLQRGFPTADAQLGNVILHRVWVTLTWNGTNYWLDPAFKVTQQVVGADLGAAMQLSTGTLLSVAGGTNTTDSIRGLNEAALRNKLRDYATNFLFDLQTFYPNAWVEDVLGVPYVVSSPTNALNDSRSGLPCTVLTNFQTLSWENIPTNFMATLNVTLADTNRLLFLPELQGQRLSLVFGNGGLGELWLEDNLLLQKQTSGGGTVDVGLSVNHPHGSWNSTNNTLIDSNAGDHSTSIAYQRTNASYAITYAFEPDPGWLRRRQERLDSYRQKGLPDTSREVVTETLNIMGLNWMTQTEWMNRLLAPEQQMLVQKHHRLGRMGQEAGKGYYIDAYMQMNGIYPASGNTPGDKSRKDRFFEWGAYLNSAAEHGLIEQLQSSNLVAASTVKMLHKANANGQRIFQAKSSSWTTGSNVRNQLTGYSTSTLNTFGAYINAGYTLLLPQHGSNAVAGAGTWAGYGAALRGVNTNGGLETQMLISGNYHGAYISTPTATADPDYLSGVASRQSDRFARNSPLTTTPFAGDPVSMVDGSFTVSATDLSVGDREPRGLSFSRHYSSARRHHNQVGMAHGWIHNYHFNLAEVSAPLAGLGTTTAEQSASMIVAAKASFELYATNGNAKNWMVTALIAKWGIDQLTSNAVSISLGPDTLQFVRQPNGTLTPPAGSTMTLTKSGSAYNLSERHGNTFKFSSAGRLTNIVDQYGQPLTITYNASNWVSTVKDWKDRTFTFNYGGTPSRLTSITDGTRTVFFGYTTSAGQLNLTSVTDPESKTSTFIYDTNHQIIATVNALNQVVTSNRYDNFGRVIEQYSQGDANQTWRLYWADYITVEEKSDGCTQAIFLRRQAQAYYDARRAGPFHRSIL
jgi:YD repeat-containing protein